MNNDNEPRWSMGMFFTLNRYGTRISWKRTERKVYQWFRDHPSNSDVADALSASAVIDQMKTHVRKYSSKVVVETIKRKQKERDYGPRA